MKSTILGLLITGLLAAPLAANAELVTNGGFETGDLTGWSCTGADLCDTDGLPHSGSFAMRGFDNDGFATLSQTIATVAGEVYDFEFFSRTFLPADPTNVLRYQIDGGSILTVATTDAYLLTSDSFIASGAATAINFFFETDPGTGTWFIDDVSVTGAVVPEPSSLALVGLALAGLGALRRRRA